MISRSLEENRVRQLFHGREVPLLRQSASQWELLVPVKIVDGKAVLKQSYEW